MKLSETLLAQFNKQITLEFESSMVYRQLAIEMDLKELPGMADWLRRQADEEIAHANKFIDHVTARDSHPKLGALCEPTVEASSPLEVFQAALAHEQKISESIRNLYRAALDDGDLDSRPLLDWFINEQIEEEDTVGEIAGRIELIGEDGSGLLRMDDALGQRPMGTTELA